MSDLPLALVLHELISVAFAAAMWSACYGLRPARLVAAPLGRVLPVAAHGRAAGAYSRALDAAGAAVRRRAWLQRLPVVRHAQPERLVEGLAESLVARAALKPATFVGKLWLSYKAVLLIKRRTPALKAAASTPAKKR